MLEGEIKLKFFNWRWTLSLFPQLDQDFMENMEDFVTLDEVAEDETKSSETPTPSVPDDTLSSDFTMRRFHVS